MAVVTPQPWDAVPQAEIPSRSQVEFSSTCAGQTSSSLRCGAFAAMPCMRLWCCDMFHGEGRGVAGRRNRGPVRMAGSRERPRLEWDDLWRMLQRERQQSYK